jgi:hypothetical protein
MFLKKYHAKLYHWQVWHSIMNTEKRAAVGFSEKHSGKSTAAVYL